MYQTSGEYCKRSVNWSVITTLTDPINDGGLLKVRYERLKRMRSSSRVIRRHKRTVSDSEVRAN